jgi:magnesium transporter
MSTEESLAQAYADEHPEEVARLFERMAPDEGARLLAALEPSSAVAVLAGADPSATARALQEVSADRAGALLEALDPRAAVDALRQVEDDQRTRLLGSLAPGRSALLTVLARYAPDTAGGRLDPRAPAFFEELSAGEVLERLVAHAYGTLHYLYAVDEARRLTGVLNLRQLTLADRAAPLSAFMVREPSALEAGDSLAVIVRHPGWMKHHALPVVEPEGRYLGAIRYGIFRAIEAELGRALSGPDPNDAAGALAELCAIGASAMARVAATALSVELGSSDRSGR